MGCCNKVSNQKLVRPAIKIPYLAVCELHRQRLRLHQCCPGCGHFCTQGSFYQCKKEGSSIHHFHKNCQVFKDNKYYCPHCGEESSQFEVFLKLNEPKAMQSFFVKSEDETNQGPKAKMTFRTLSRGTSKEQCEEEAPAVTAIIKDTPISSAKLPAGPARNQLEAILEMLNTESGVKKIRTGPKNLYMPSLSGDLEKVVFLLSEGSDPNQHFEEQNNETALHAAAYHGHLAIVHCLVQAGAMPNALDAELKTPLMCAAEMNKLDVIDYLLKCGAALQLRAEDGMAALHLAAKAGHLDVVKYFLNTGKVNINTTDDGGWTALVWAAEYQHVSTVKFLLDIGADPNLKDQEGNTALHWAAFSGAVNVAELFLNAGCDVESSNEHGDRPLHIAARQDHYNCVVLFLARGADSEGRNNQNQAPISCCVDQTTQAWMALRVNKQLKGFAAKQLMKPERLLHRDISMGKESVPVPVVNGVDDENYPDDFLYVADNIETTPLNVNRVLTSLQHCRCRDNCASVFCVCGRNSVQSWYDKEGRLVKEFNQQEPPLLFECNKACLCWTNCQNRVVQHGVTCRLQVFRTKGRGWGLRTLLNIKQGTFVCEYVGEHISDAEADSREDDSYLFDLDNKDGDTFCIDARKYANLSRFINHLCEPNLVTVKVFTEHQDLRFPKICFFASRDIKANEELGFDYGEKFWIIKWKQFTCACGSPKCRYSSETIHKTIEEYNKRIEEEDDDSQA